MASSTFAVSQRMRDTDGVDNIITIGPAPAKWYLSRIFASTSGSRSRLFVTIDGVQVFSAGLPQNDVESFDFGNGKSSEESARGIPVGQQQVAVLTLKTEDDVPPPGWISDLNVMGTVIDFGQLDFVAAAVSLSADDIPGGRDPVPGETLEGSVFGR